MKDSQCMEAYRDRILKIIEVPTGTILYYDILCYTRLYYTILYYTILYYTILYYTILYYTTLLPAGSTISSWLLPRRSPLMQRPLKILVFCAPLLGC